jgi:hypothetical protein
MSTSASEMPHNFIFASFISPYSEDVSLELSSGDVEVHDINFDSTGVHGAIGCGETPR